MFVISAALALLIAPAAFSKTGPAKTSGVYLTATDYQAGRLAFAGDCGSKEHKLELHDVLHKSYIHVTHGSDKRKYAKADLFGFRACNGKDYRFATNLEYLILENKDLYIYAQDIWKQHGKVGYTERAYYVSAGPSGDIVPLTMENLKRIVPDNQKFQSLVDRAFGPAAKGAQLAEYDKTRKMFRLNELLMASRKP
jgi:hypothetical protein